MTKHCLIPSLALVALAALPDAAQSAGLDCRARRMTQAESTICNDPRLSRMEDDLSRRITRASRQLAFGPYLGLRVWQGDWQQQRKDCLADRSCLLTAYGEANRFLDRLQGCIGTSYRGRRCLPVTVDGERSLVRRP